MSSRALAAPVAGVARRLWPWKRGGGNGGNALRAACRLLPSVADLSQAGGGGRGSGGGGSEEGRDAAPSAVGGAGGAAVIFLVVLEEFDLAIIDQGVVVAQGATAGGGAGGLVGIDIMARACVEPVAPGVDVVVRVALALAADDGVGVEVHRVSLGLVSGVDEGGVAIGLPHFLADLLAVSIDVLELHTGGGGAGGRLRAE
mmetsp:Transcript_1261/g.5143  ORF Transcript_1261/g.5143 Transcript_1261/m.5143 type:complete len:201 (-) Transcript_1261:593-1195(-)